MLNHMTDEQLFLWVVRLTGGGAAALQCDKRRWNEARAYKGFRAYQRKQGQITLYVTYHGTIDKALVGQAVKQWWERQTELRDKGGSEQAKPRQREMFPTAG